MTTVAGTEPGGVTNQRLDRGATELFTQLIRAAKPEMAQLHQTFDAGLAARAASDHQRSDRFDVAVTGLGPTSRPT